ncbi:hypothetical protein CDN99_16380 [Roseateles aquatilis]|uniref:Uncharacterized protein n=1 Tax=Roseateles aquatilis TaxID=431061 RepID=A0A246J7F9_9BURK|nr:hypothetical protein [Roseateles aquatilis]OWQ88435.1 hypothetical protein CDN99_16380 [Roseateles aquatilis]
MLEERYEKTEAGRAEIKSRDLVQARVARNLLLVIDAGKTGGDWLALVQGAAPADLELLLALRLVQVAAGAPPTRPMAGASSRLTGVPTSSLDFTQLYTALSAFAKQQGLLKGYKLALAVEQCQDIAQLQTLALDVVDRVRASKGDAAAHELRATLGFN